MRFDGEIAEAARLDALLDEVDLGGVGQRQRQIGDGDELTASRLGQLARAPDAVDGEVAPVVDHPVPGSSLPEPGFELLSAQGQVLRSPGSHREPQHRGWIGHQRRIGHQRLHGSPPRAPTLALPPAGRWRVLAAM
jgi:hypothetical protein